MRIDRSRFLLLVGAIAASTGMTPKVEALEVDAESDPTGEEEWVDEAEPLADGSCDNTAGAPQQCTLRAPGPQCESFLDTKKECPVVRGLLDARVAEAFVRCLNQKSGTQAICDFESASTCFAEAMPASCIEPATESTCKRLVRGCDDAFDGKHELTLRSCQQLLSASVSSQHRRLVTSMSESCSARYGYWDLSTVAHGN